MFVSFGGFLSKEKWTNDNLNSKTTLIVRLNQSKIYKVHKVYKVNGPCGYFVN